MDQAFKDLTDFLNWTRMGIIYEDYGFGEYFLPLFGDAAVQGSPAPSSTLTVSIL